MPCTTRSTARRATRGNSPYPACARAHSTKGEAKPTAPKGAAKPTAEEAAEEAESDALWERLMALDKLDDNDNE